MKMDMLARMTQKRVAYKVAASLLVATVFAYGVNASPGVTVDSVIQRWPWNNKVDITYTVTDGQDVEAGVYCRLVFNANINGETYVIDGVTNVGASASSGTHTITWNPPSGVKTANCSMTATLLAADNPSGDDYMVVDLDTGKITYEGLLASQAASNARYNTAAYKTDKLVLRKIPRTADSPCPNGYRTGDNGSSFASHNSRANWVTYKDYYIGVFPVTQWQFNKLYGSNPSTFQADGEGDNHWHRPVDKVRWYEARRTTITTNEVVDVDSANLSNTKSFLGHLNMLTKSGSGVKGFDLPTKIMGEIAAHGGADTLYPWGDTYISGVYVNYAVVNTNTTVAVGSKQPNGFGLYDTLGNVMEWALDDYFNSRTNCADAPDPWTPAYDPATDGSHKKRLFVNGAYYPSKNEFNKVMSPAYWSGTDWNSNGSGFGFRVAFIVK